MRRGLIGIGLALVALIIWLGSDPRPTTDREPTRIAAPKVTDAVKNDADLKDAPAAPEHPVNWAAAAPAPTGSAGKGSLQSNSRAVRGTIERLSGTIQIYNIAKAAYSGGADSRLELSVDSGTVRAYLQYFPDSGGFFKHQDGYLFAQAEPGKPAMVEGMLAWGGGSGENETYAVTFESVGGDASGLRYTITPRK
ncbi:hypothetical protein SAMN05519104_0771 [Rhizobiales bacterium GAS188]|nr:hypothetical protein SAMN05519104_0771 [Rhizobiales bacterium GAS188]